MENAFDRLLDFAKANGLTVKILDQGTYYIFVFRNDLEGSEYRHACQVGEFESSFSKIVNAVREFFAVTPAEDSVENAVQIELNGLTKHEYIALELTKAWAGVAYNSYFDEEDIVGRYETMLKEVKERNL